jgi:hypothetical protein
MEGTLGFQIAYPLANLLCALQKSRYNRGLGISIVWQRTNQYLPPMKNNPIER